jgi:hypothetical protein
VAAKPQLVAIRERVSSDMKNGANPQGSVLMLQMDILFPF